MPRSENWPFTRLMIDHLFHGTTRVWWELDPSFNYAPPHTFQLQAGYTGNNNALDWVNIGSEAINAYYLTDDTDRELASKRLLTHYRVILTADTSQFVSNPQAINGLLTKQEWLIAKEITRKEQLRAVKVSRPGYLLRRMRYGSPATATDYLTDAITDSHDPSSWGTAFKVGYHPPVSLDVDFDNNLIRERKGGTNVAEYNTQPGSRAARVLAFPDLAKEDVWVDAVTDERWKIHDIQVTSALRGVPLISTVEMRLVPFSDIIYKIPVTSASYDISNDDVQPTVGTGCVRVDHDYGEDDAYVYQTGDCCGIEGATILAFLKSDWDLSLRTPEYAKATSQTTTNGEWAWAMLLDPGTYVLVFEKVGEYGPDTVEVTVEVPITPPPDVSSSSSLFGSF